MIDFILTILLTTTWLVSFRALKLLKIHTFQAVVINYWVCVITGIIVFQPWGELALTFQKTWLPYAFALGGIFILTFYLTALGSQIVGIAATSIASKISLVIPVFFSLFIFETVARPFDWINYLGIFLSLFAIILSSLKKSSTQTHFNQRNLVRLIIIFALTGLSDLGVNYINLSVITPTESYLFPIYTFGSSALIGTFIVLYLGSKNGVFFTFKSLLGGIWIGIPNFFSLYYLLESLTYFNNNGAFLFPMFNIGIIVLSSLAAVFIYRERLSLLNQLGVLLAVISIFFIAYHEVFEVLSKLLRN